MSESADVRRLLARGTTIELADGASHELRFSSRSLATIEDDYDGLESFTAALRRKPFRTVAYVLSVTLGVSPEQAIDLVDSRRLDQYVEAIGDAFEEALPEQERELQIVQNHEHEGRRYKAGSTVTVTAAIARHLIEARVAVPPTDEGNGVAAPGASPGAAGSTSPSSSGPSSLRASGA